MQLSHIAIVLLAVCALSNAQQPGHQKQDGWPSLSYSTCTKAGGCTSTPSNVVMDSNWAWTHKAGTYTNCYTGSQWDKSLCPDPATCAKNCALDAGSVSEYKSTYGVSSTGAALTLDFVTKQQYGTNVGSRNYLYDANSDQYVMFKLKNKEFTFDVDVSQLPCGLNGALYFVQMDADGGKSKYPGNTAGAAYGTGYCDAQCPHDIKFINGEANILDWKSSGASTGTGKYGTCCTEMDIWESNKVSQAVTPHVCTVDGQTRCQGKQCGDDASGERQEGVCDKDGCDWNPFRLGDKDFFGPGANFTIDSTQPMTVVTQFITVDGTDTGDLKEIRRKYVQAGKEIPMNPITIGGKTFDSVSDDFCTSQKAAFNDTDGFGARGGLKALGSKLDTGMVLVMSLWDDSAVDMLWLDSTYPPTKDPSAPGVARGTCSPDSGKPDVVEKQSPNSKVTYSNIKFGEIGSTTGGSPTPPSPPGPPSPPPGPPPSGCPGGSLSACMALCPSSPPAVYKACVSDCAKRCA